MGAILAIIGESGDHELASRLERMIACSPYRGAAERRIEGGVALAVQSLGSDGSLASGGNWLVAFQGWIGNWDELASGSEQGLAGSASDAERLAAGYEALGDRLFARLRGEFAALILDRRASRVLAVRDVVGARPLFWERAGDRAFIATEIRQVLAGSRSPRRLDEEFVVDWLAYAARSPEPTPFAGVRQFAPGRVSVFSTGPGARHEPSSREFWSPPDTSTARTDFEELAAELRQRLERAVRRSLPPRPFTLCLSGGVDSGTIWGLISQEARQGNTLARHGAPYSAVYPGWRCDESGYVRATLEHTGTQGVLLDATAARAAEYLPRKAAEVDWPPLPLGMAMELLARRARSDGRQVILDGFGGDEWLAGSPGYLADLLAAGHVAQWALDLARLRLDRVGSGRSLLAAALPFRPRFWRRPRPAEPPSWLGQRWRQRWVEGKAPRPEGSPYRRQRLWLLRFIRAGDAHVPWELELARLGMEPRRPLMDLDLIEFAFATPGRWLMLGRRRKHLYRAAARDVLAPAVHERRVRSSFEDVSAAGLAETALAASVESWSLVRRGVLEAAGLQSLVARLGAGDRPDASASGWWDLFSAENLARALGES